MCTAKLDSKIIIDTTKYNSMAKYVNYSYDPNYFVVVYFNNRIPRLSRFTIRNIKINEESTFDCEQDLETNHLPTPSYYKSKNYYGHLQLIPKLKFTIYI